MAQEKQLLMGKTLSHPSRWLQLVALILLMACSLPAHAEEKKSVLYLNSYHNGYQWSDGLLAGVRSVLNSGPYLVDLQIEYMDAKKFNYDNVSKNLLALYREKFKTEQFDIIVLSDNDALNFVNAYRDELFPGLPVVFCGINDLKAKDTAGGDITGVVEVFDFTKTIEIARKLHPQRNKLVVLIDDSTAGTAIRRQIEHVLEESMFDLDVEFWVQLSLEEAQRRVRRLPSDTFLFIAPYYLTINGRFYTSEEVSEAIYRHSSVPLYTAWEFMVGYGAVGGKVLSGFEQGKIAGQMAMEILQGKPAHTIPIIDQPGGVYVFDHDVMQRLGLNQRLLPAGSKIINAPSNFYSLSKELFWTIMIGFVLLLLAFVSMIGAMLERRKIELKITEQLAFQETLMDTIPQLVSWKNLDGLYLGANRAFMDFFGATSSQGVVNQTTKSIVGDKSYSDWSVRADAEVVQHGRPFRKVRRRVIDWDGNIGWLEVNKVPLRGQGGRIVGVLSTAENITKEQNLEKQLLQSQKMEAIGTLAGGIAHDFNNILTSIINSTELALSDLPEEGQTAADLNRVLKAARRGGRVVQQILSFSRPSREGFRPTDLLQVVHEVVHLLEASLPANITIGLQAENFTSLYVNANPTQMHQAILNLCTNAFHALRQRGGEIRIRLASECLLPEVLAGPGDGEAGKDQRRILLEVADNGPGISPSILDKIFDPFFSTKSKSEGTGLGLAVVHGIVQSHQGTIQVVSTPGNGCTFTITLPEIEAGEGIVSSSQDHLSENLAHILFVEDDEDQLNSTPRLLEEMGFTVLAVRDPKTAINMAQKAETQFDLLLTDFDMPTMSGAELAMRLNSLPTILVSGREDAHDAALQANNIRRVLIKPYDKQDLRLAIHQALRKDNHE